MSGVRRRGREREGNIPWHVELSCHHFIECSLDSISLEGGREREGEGE